MYKTVLIHLNDERRAGQLIDAAAHIADRHSAHLIGLFVVPPSVVGPFTRVAGRLVQGGRQAFRDEASRIRAAFEVATAGRPVVAEWRTIEPSHDHPGCAEAVIEQARAADLVVTSQSDPSWEYSVLLDFPERLALESGRPTLVVPHAGRFPHWGRRVLVAWNGKREAARAVFDALPVLKEAEAVRVLWVNPGNEPGASTGLTAVEIAAALARHGVKCETAQSVTAGLEVSDDLLSRLADFGADLLVMGCYGHSRFREMVLGGASRGILAHATVPVMMSH
jgi:nucleotide-binding universal stress UspA family protein